MGSLRVLHLPQGSLSSAHSLKTCPMHVSLTEKSELCKWFVSLFGLWLWSSWKRLQQILVTLSSAWMATWISQTYMYYTLAGRTIHRKPQRHQLDSVRWVWWTPSVHFGEFDQTSSGNGQTVVGETEVSFSTFSLQGWTDIDAPIIGLLWYHPQIQTWSLSKFQPGAQLNNTMLNTDQWISFCTGNNKQVSAVPKSLRCTPPILVLKFTGDSRSIRM